MSSMMMQPASDSSSDYDSSSSESSVEEARQGRKSIQDRADIEPVDSDDDGSDDDDDDHDDGEFGAHQVSNFDDLPTDDSGDESDSDSDDISVDQQREVGSSYDGEEGGLEEKIRKVDVPLSERVASQAQEGRRYYTGADKNDNGHGFEEVDGGKKRRVQRKTRAIELASERLRKAREVKGVKKSTFEENASDDGSVEQSTSNRNNGSKGEAKPKKKSKHAPTEMSSKRRDYFSRGRPDLNSSGIGVSIGANKYKSRDPRMITLSGHLDDDVFEKRYGFLDEVKGKEIDQLKKRVKAWNKSGKKGQKERKKLGMTKGGGSLEEDQEELIRLTQERAERKKANVMRAAKRSVKQKIRDDVASGKSGAYYPKRSEMRKMEAEAKFDEIHKRGGDTAVDQAIAKRRKKNLSKAAKQMPSHFAK